MLPEPSAKIDDEALSEAEIQKFKALAAQVRDDRHFAAILNTVTYDRRRPLYDMIKPYLSFKPKPFYLYRFY